jgi:hypothetical protein
MLDGWSDFFVATAGAAAALAGLIIVLLVFIGAVTNAWVLLVEILR